jgi:hypothetical protein
MEGYVSSLDIVVGQHLERQQQQMKWQQQEWVNQWAR